MKGSHLSTGPYHAIERQVFLYSRPWADDFNFSSTAYNGFTRYGRSSAWCKAHALSFRAMSRAISIRAQLKKYMQRFGLPLESCQGDAKRLRQCLVSGYWRNGARWVADGTYRSVRGNVVRALGIVFSLTVVFTAISLDVACASSFRAFHAQATVRMGRFS